MLDGAISDTMSCMKIGDTEVFTLAEAAERLGVAHDTLRRQVRLGALPAQKMGKQWVVNAEDLATYDAQRKGPRGFARDDHPLHGKQGPGHRRKKDESA